MSARELAARFEADKKQINSRLYGALKGRVQQDNKYRWRLVDDAAPEAPLKPGFENTDLARLARYYLSCIGQDDLGISTFAWDKYGNPDYSELETLPGGAFNIWETESARRMLGKLRKDKSRLALYFGYPTALSLLKSKRSSWQGYMVEPLLLFPVQLDEQMRPSLELGFPVINQKAFRQFTNAQGPEVMEELVQLEDELGLTDIESPPELDELVTRLEAIRPEWPWREAIDTEALSTSPSLAEIEEEGIFNRAVLVTAERSKFTQGLETELTQLARLKPGASDGTALGHWLAAEVPEHSAEDAPPLEVLPMNLEQRQAVRSALSRPLTIITGPPGTGKSQVVTNLLVNAAWRGQRVLFASKNNKAVDVVEQRVNNLGPRPVLLRLGSNQYQGRLAEYLMALLAATATEEDRLYYREALERHEDLMARLEQTQQEADTLVERRNRVGQLEQAVEDIRGDIPHEVFAGMQTLDADAARASVDIITDRIERADRERQIWLVKLFWFMTRKARFEALANEAEAQAELLDQLGVQSPKNSPDDIAMPAWREFYKDVAGRVVQACKVREYFDGLQALQSAKSLEQISVEVARLEHALSKNAQTLWENWLRLQPDRLSQADRQKLNKYNSTLKMVIDQAGDGMLPKQVYREYSSLFPKISHLLSCWAVTSLSAKGRIPFEPGYFDLVVFDEASQCDIASALPLLYRAKRAAVIGDPKQLAHISGLVRGQDQQLLDKFNLVGSYPHWAYSYNSLFDLAAGLSSGAGVIALRDHHRSHADIIEFSNREFYEGRLRVATPYEHLARPDPSAPGISWRNVAGEVKRPGTGGAINAAESAAVVEALKDLVVNRGYQGSLGVVTPFRAQANLIRQQLSQDDSLYERLIRQGLLVDTVHKFQGDERDLMVFSPVISKGISRGALGFLSNNGNLFNVAITRARAQLMVVGDRKACAESGVSYMEHFAHYVGELQEQKRRAAVQSEQELGPEYPTVTNPEQVSDWEHIIYKALYRAGIRPIPQYTVEKYRLDFALFDGERKLDLEVDGERYHRNWSGELCRRDQLRNQRMFELGWDVMRFWVYEIRDDLDGCIERVQGWLDEGRQE